MSVPGSVLGGKGSHCDINHITHRVSISLNRILLSAMESSAAERFTPRRRDLIVGPPKRVGANRVGAKELEQKSWSIKGEIHAQQ